MKKPIKKKKKSKKRKRELIELDLFFQIWRSEIEKECDISFVKNVFLYRAFIKKHTVKEIEKRYIKNSRKNIENIDLSLISML